MITGVCDSQQIQWFTWDAFKQLSAVAHKVLSWASLSMCAVGHKRFSAIAKEVCLFPGTPKCQGINLFSAYLNFQQIEVMSRYRDPQFQVGEITHI